jgi:hypothetical protein
LTIRESRSVRLRDGINNRFVRVYADQGLTGTGEFMDTLGAEYIINNNFSPALADAIRSILKVLFIASGKIRFPAARRAPSSFEDWAGLTSLRAQPSPSTQVGLRPRPQAGLLR